MALDRQSIEKRDFPVGRRGYDPDAVDAHLSALADEVAELKRTTRRRDDTLAAAASEQVRTIVEAAEASAAEIQREAEAEATQARDEANAEAQATREQATRTAREYVGKVSESTGAMLERLAAMQAELDTLIESLRGGGDRLGADLTQLQASLAEVSAVVAPRPAFEPDPPAEPELAPERAPEPERASEPAAPGGAIRHPSAPLPDGDSDEDLEGARLIALNMALNGTPREETAHYLGANFSLRDPDGLLDEVYASVED